jgi:formamidopyrimidine-DNA glycosylase
MMKSLCTKVLFCRNILKRLRKRRDTIPEGPELRVSADILKKRMVGCYLVNAYVSGGRYTESLPAGFDEFIAEMRGSSLDGERIEFTPDYPGFLIKDVDVKGKFMWWELANGWYVWSTYGMSGQWTFSSEGSAPKHTAVSFYLALSGGEPFEVHDAVHFRDPRHFGTVKFSRGREALDAKLATLGPDMLSKPPSIEEFRLRLRRKSAKTLAEALMDQNTISGVGNYIKAEALYAARLSPHRKCESLKDVDLDRLRDSIIDIMCRSYQAQGTSVYTYNNVDGSRGSFADQLLVYGKSNVHGHKVIKEETLDGRTTHWVPAVQV